VQKKDVRVVSVLVNNLYKSLSVKVITKVLLLSEIAGPFSEVSPLVGRKGRNDKKNSRYFEGERQSE
jgi:hypothetical protein